MEIIDVHKNDFNAIPENCSNDLLSNIYFQSMEVGQAGQVGHLVHVLVVWALLHVREVARIQLLSLVANLVPASLRKPSLAKTSIVVSIVNYRYFLCLSARILIISRQA